MFGELQEYRRGEFSLCLPVNDFKGRVGFAEEEQTLGGFLELGGDRVSHGVGVKSWFLKLPRFYQASGIATGLQELTHWGYVYSLQNQALAEWQIVRLGGKQTRRRLTDAIKAYIDRHPELSENNRKWLYVNASQRVTLVVFGRKAKKLAEDLGVAPDSLRDALTPVELLLLQEVEDTAMRLIDIQDVHPDEAIAHNAERLLIQVQTRALQMK